MSKEMKELLNVAKLKLAGAVTDFVKDALAVQDGYFFFRIGTPVGISGDIPTSDPSTYGPQKGILVMAFELAVVDQVELNLDVRSRKGRPGQIQEGSVKWMVDKPELLALLPSEDGKICTIVPLGPLGSAVVSVSGDADLGEGETLITASIEVHVNPGNATELAIRPGTIVPQSEAEEAVQEGVEAPAEGEPAPGEATATEGEEAPAVEEGEAAPEGEAATE